MAMLALPLDRDQAGFHDPPAFLGSSCHCNVFREGRWQEQELECISHMAHCVQSHGTPGVLNMWGGLYCTAAHQRGSARPVDRPAGLPSVVAALLCCHQTGSIIQPESEMHAPQRNFHVGHMFLQ